MHCSSTGYFLVLNKFWFKKIDNGHNFDNNKHYSSGGAKETPYMPHKTFTNYNNSGVKKGGSGGCSPPPPPPKIFWGGKPKKKFFIFITFNHKKQNHEPHHTETCSYTAEQNSIKCNS